jgi:hypothetical protein
MKNMSALLLLSLLSTSTFATALTTDTLALRGTVNKKISIAVTADTAALNLDLETDTTDLLVATVNEKSNSKTGYTIQISSSNLGSLKRTGGSEIFGYALSYGSSAVDLSASAGTTLTNSAAEVANATKDVKISYTGKAAETMVEGTYTDTVTFTIAAI